VIAASVPDWIGALSTLALGVVGTLFGWYQWRASRFNPKVEGKLAVKGDSIRVTVTNRGRLEGKINMVEVLDSNYKRVPLLGADATFSPFPLYGGSAEVLDFNAPDGRDFGEKDTVRIEWGGGEDRRRLVPVSVSFYDTKTPPGALRGYVGTPGANPRP
jgi:hypothetical protein